MLPELTKTAYRQQASQSKLCNYLNSYRCIKRQVSFL